MVPFLNFCPGGSQESIIDLELVTLKVMFSDIAVYIGTITHVAKMSLHSCCKI